MKCPKCQFDNPEGMKFCGECGAGLEKICPKCDFSNPPQFKFCGECGHALAEPTEAPPIDYAHPLSLQPQHQHRQSVEYLDRANQKAIKLNALEEATAYAGYGRFHKLQGNIPEARKYLADALEIFERLGTLIQPDKVREELAGLPEP